MNEKKARHHWVGLDFDGPTAITGVRANDDGTVEFFGVDGKVLPINRGFSGVAYERLKGPKVTYQMPDQGEVIGSLSRLSRYSQIIGVDTNCRTLQGEKTCVTAVAKLDDLKFKGPRWSATIDPLWALEFREPQKPPERIGWRHALARGENLGWLKDGRTTLLVVDAYLNDLDNINKRRLPLIDDFFLPESVSIAYASSDAATDSPLNGLITWCDRIAREVFNHIVNPSVALSPLLATRQSPFRTHRYWTIEN